MSMEQTTIQIRECKTCGQQFPLPIISGRERHGRDYTFNIPHFRRLPTKNILPDSLDFCCEACLVQALENGKGGRKND